MPVMCLRFSDLPILIHNWVCIFHRVLSHPNSDVLYCENYQTKKPSGCYEMFTFSKATLLHLSTTHLLFLGPLAVAKKETDQNFQRTKVCKELKGLTTTSKRESLYVKIRKGTK